MSSAECIELFVPGRVCLFGEHSDWAGSFRRFNSALEKGFTIVCGTNHGLYARVRTHPRSLILTSTDENGEQRGPEEIPMQAEALLRVAQEGGFWSYAAGVAFKILTDYRVSGLVIDNYRTTLPLKKGLSSSAALCVLVARAFNRVYDLKMTTRGEMEYAYQGEIMTPSRCGRMDQACAFGTRPVLMTYDGEFLGVQPLHVPSPLFLVIVDLKAHKDTVEILSSLQKAFPFAEGEVQEGVVQLLGATNKRITHAATVAMQRGDMREVGRLMAEAQLQFDQYAGRACPSQLTAPVLHKVLAWAPLAAHVLGGKGVGAGGDGTAQLLCADEAAQRAVMQLVEEGLGMPCLPLTIAAANPITCAVLPCAGFGAALFPSTRAVKAELSPVVDEDGLLKPAVLINVQTLVRAGVQRVVLVVQQEDVPGLTRLFHTPLSAANEAVLSPHARRVEREILELGKAVQLVVQERQRGLAHAVLCAQEVVGEEPFLVVLGDHLYKGPAQEGRSCAAQVMRAFQEEGRGVVGVQASNATDACKYGVLTGVWQEGTTRIAEEGAAGTSRPETTHVEVPLAGRPGSRLAVSAVAEKPSPELVDARLQTPGVDGVLTFFGIYALPATAWPILREVHTHTSDLGSGFTVALDRLREAEGLGACVLEGKRFDLGDVDGLCDAVVNYRHAL